MKSCIACNEPLEDDAKFCSECRAQQPERVVEPQETKTVKRTTPQKAEKNNNVQSNGSHLVSMKIEDVFGIQGRGTVVTGKVTAGSIKLNEVVTILGGSQSIRTKVISIEMYGKSLDVAKVGDSVGLLLRGVDKKDIKRDYIVTVDAEQPEKVVEPEETKPVKKETSKKAVMNNNTHLFSMKIDSVFLIHGGYAIIVAGKITAGSIKLNDEVIILGGVQKINAIVSGIEVYNKPVDVAKDGDNVSLELRNTRKKDINKDFKKIKSGYIVTVDNDYR